MSGRSLSDEHSTRSASWWGWGEEVGMGLPPQAHRRESGLAFPQRTQAASPQVYRIVVHRLCKHHCSNHIIRHSAGFLGTWLLLMYFIISFFLLSLLLISDFSSLFDFYPYFNYLVIPLWIVYVTADFALTVSTFCWHHALLLPILMFFVTPGSRLPQKTIQLIHPSPTSHTWC